MSQNILEDLYVFSNRFTMYDKRYRLYLNLIVSIPLCTYISFIKLSRLYTTNK